MTTELKGDALAAAYQHLLQSRGHDHNVFYHGGGWFKVRRPKSPGDGLRVRADYIRKRMEELTVGIKD